MTTPPENRFARHRRKTIAVVLVAAFAAFDLAAGTIVEAARRRALDAYHASERRYRIPSAQYHHDLRANVSLDDARWGPGHYKVRTNSLGFRDRSVRDVPLASTRRRILLIGDSFTEGVGVDYEKTFAALLEDALAARDRSVEVLNAGCSSYFPGIYLAKVRHFLLAGLAVSEVVVCIDMSDAHDESVIEYPPPSAPAAVATASSVAPAPGTPAPEPSPPAPAPAASPSSDQRALEPPGLAVFLHDHTFVTFNLLKLAKDALAPPLPAEVIPPRGLWTVREDLERAYAALGNERAVAHMDELAAFLAARGVPLTVVVYPWPASVWFHDRDSKQARLWREWSARRGARFVDLFPLFVTDEPPLETIHRYFFAGDVHWNEAGHRLVAKGLLEGRPW